MADGVRITQGYIEALVAPQTTPGVRLTQGFIEALVTPESAKQVRVTEAYVEVILPKDWSPLQPRISLAYTEVIQSKLDQQEKTPGIRNTICP